mmetsp:Transcript_16433/g.16367  ORF Transcript_16433/g.16367 Transcript_16433/m.16367 type:complete len:88 (+) Transcript_16433:145-408(+)
MHLPHINLLQSRQYPINISRWAEQRCGTSSMSTISAKFTGRKSIREKNSLLSNGHNPRPGVIKHFFMQLLQKVCPQGRQIGSLSFVS